MVMCVVAVMGRVCSGGVGLSLVGAVPGHACRGGRRGGPRSWLRPVSLTAAPCAGVGRAGGPPHTRGPPLWHLLLPPPCVWGQMHLPGEPALPASAWPWGRVPSSSGEGLRSRGEKGRRAGRPRPRALAASGAVPSDPLCRPLGRRPWAWCCGAGPGHGHGGHACVPVVRDALSEACGSGAECALSPEVVPACPPRRPRSEARARAGPAQTLRSFGFGRPPGSRLSGHGSERVCLQGLLPRWVLLNGRGPASSAALAAPLCLGLPRRP